MEVKESIGLLHLRKYVKVSLLTHYQKHDDTMLVNMQSAANNILQHCGTRLQKFAATQEN